ncbi:helix-turn-helix transcriptional regulator [Aureimonas fodinaquatilis]|uniref:Helix-turn-helix transcriptional regulator n=1 Tax=Aureimonas fodinaquatilis TaxID=2565783 RepID=A0A5B0E0U6_9HYPH|nr:helix-turn-helix transcriptional regulator [Aureimonas fodinaquatilis]KAA0971745.1 helix-turn-helix transcriptional regulator [Aureimonas fodinaquatilis]
MGKDINGLGGDDFKAADKAEDLLGRQRAKRIFSERLKELMREKNWSQSELARRSNLSRDRISVYLRAAALPSASALKMLASALDVTVEALMSTATSAHGIDNELKGQTPFQLKVIPGSGHLALIKVYQTVSLKTALKIAELLANDEPNP